VTCGSGGGGGRPLFPDDCFSDWLTPFLLMIRIFVLRSRLDKRFMKNVSLFLLSYFLANKRRCDFPSVLSSGGVDSFFSALTPEGPVIWLFLVLDVYFRFPSSLVDPLMYLLAQTAGSGTRGFRILILFLFPFFALDKTFSILPLV